MFIARVSKGRTIREFLTGVLFAPTLLGTFWFAAFGTTAIDIQMNGLVDLTKFSTELTIFEMFEAMPWSLFLSIAAIILIASFFITSADSATFVLGMQSTNGSLTPSNNVKLVWGADSVNDCRHITLSERVDRFTKHHYYCCTAVFFRHGAHGHCIDKSTESRSFINQKRKAI